MTLMVHVHGGYPSYAGSGEAWNDADYEAMKLVKALKGLPFKGYASLLTPTGALVTVRENDTVGAFRIFGEWAAAKLAELGVADGVLMAVPSSSCIGMGTDAKGQKLVEAIRQRSTAFQPIDGLWWKEEFNKSAKGGTRNSAALEANLVVREGPTSKVVLVDDVVSSGGHLLACARALRAKGHTVEHALCAAQTVNTHPGNIWKIESRDLEACDNLSWDF